MESSNLQYLNSQLNTSHIIINLCFKDSYIQIRNNIAELIRQNDYKIEGPKFLTKIHDIELELVDKSISSEIGCKLFNDINEYFTKNCMNLPEPTNYINYLNIYDEIIYNIYHDIKYSLICIRGQGQDIFTFFKDYPLFSVKRFILDHDQIIKDNCAICCDDLQHGQHHYVCMLKCKHQFHKPCIDKWIHINLTCPICKHEL